MPTLDWLNRDAAFKIANDVPYRLLEAVSEHRANVSAPTVKTLSDKGKVAENAESRPDLFSALEPISYKEDSEKPLPPGAVTPTSAPATEDNLLIHGDNLEALKALLPFYRGQVKCIFIDPPYNTKSAFEHYDDNLEHAQWLSMMLPRLQLLRELLREDGSIWVTIDDNEGHYLKVLMDEVFGRGNFVANVVWQKRTSADARLRLGAAHDNILVYSNQGSSPTFNLLPANDLQTLNFKNPDQDSRGPWASTDFTAQGWRPNQMYTITTPDGTQYEPPPGRCWANVEPEFLRLRDAEKRIWFGVKGDSRPRVKNFLSESSGMSSWTWWTNREVGHNQESKKEINELFGADGAFTTPKPERLLERILRLATNENDLVLDSFSGSGTTAAVAQKMGRRWIGIEMGEHAKTHCLPRLQKVLDGEQGGISKTVNWQGGGSFRFMQLGAPVFDETGAIHPNVRFATLAAFVWMQETGVPWHGTAPTVRPERSEGSDNSSAPVRETLRQAQGERTKQSPFLGTHNGVDYFLLFNGVLGDKRPNAGNVLTRAVLLVLTTEFPSNGRPRVIYGESNRLGEERLKEAQVQFKSIPHEVVKR